MRTCAFRELLQRLCSLWAQVCLSEVCRDSSFLHKEEDTQLLWRSWGRRDGDGLKNTYLPTTGFDHELPSQVRSRLWLQWADNNALVQRVTRDNLEGKEVSGR